MDEWSDFRARAGTLTLLFVASSVDREALLRILVNALEGRPILEDCPPEEEFDEFGPEGMAEIELDSGVVVGPHTQVTISPAGRELLFVASVLERWLSRSPGGAVRLGDEAAGAALAALVFGWSATIVHAMAGEPRTLEELSQIVDIVSYETLEEHVEALVATGLAEAQSNGSEPRYAVTDWLRAGIAPLAAAARLELRNQADDTAPIDALDVSAGFMLLLPLVQLPADLSGACRLGVELEDGTMASAVARVAPGLLTSGDLGIELEEIGTWATASVNDWLDTLIEPDAKRVRTGGDRALASALVNGAHQALFGTGAL